MSKLIDLVGRKFSRWFVIVKSEKKPNKGRDTYWLCRCDCGIEREVLGNRLKTEGSKSCGCFEKDMSRERMKGDNNPSKRLEVREKIREKAKGRKPTEETREKMSRARMGKISWIKGKTKENNESVRKIAESKMGENNVMKRKEVVEKRNKTMSKPEVKEKYKKSLKESHNRPEVKERHSRASKESHNRPEVKEKHIKKMKRLWKDPDFVSKQMKARGVKPNKIELKFEQFLNSLYPGEWKYVGDGQLIINGKCPDFVNVNGQKKIIELFGDYWHKGQNPEDRVKIFEPFGYQTLVIWESELKNKQEVKEQICKFVEDTSERKVPLA